MALQRTRGLVVVRPVRAAGRRSAVGFLPGGRSPLNAVALGGSNVVQTSEDTQL